MNHVYDATFYEYINRGALRSAEAIVGRLMELLPIKEVIDIGCGQGAWLSVWKKLGASRVRGVDGDYVDRNALLIAPEEFTPWDLTRPLACEQRYTLCQSLEVAEHLPDAAADEFVRTLVNHADLVLFSAAVPGQGGENHINEQNYEYWRRKFAAQGYVAVDCVRGAVRDNSAVEVWYRYNTLLYVKSDILEQLPAPVRAARVADNEPIADVAPLAYRLRRRLVALLPPSVATLFAIAKKHGATLLRGGAH